MGKQQLKLLLLLFIAVSLFIFQLRYENVSAEKDFYDYVAETGSELRQHLVNRESPITVRFNLGTSSLGGDFTHLFKIILDDAVKYTGKPYEGDYLSYQISYWSGTLRKYSNYTILTYEITYETTFKQEQEVNNSVSTILSGLNLDGKSEYEKIKAIYDWICNNVSYNLEGNHTTAYNALILRHCACQGYAVAVYRLMNEAGIECHVLQGSGDPDSQTYNHCWNIVKIDDSFYLLDATSDNHPTGGYKRFLHGSGDWNGYVYLDDDHYEYNISYYNYVVPITGVQLKTSDQSIVEKFYNVYGTPKAVVSDRVYSDIQYYLSISVEHVINGVTTIKLPQGFSFDFDQLINTRDFEIINGYHNSIPIFPIYINLDANADLIFELTGCIEKKLDFPLELLAGTGTVFCRPTTGSDMIPKSISLDPIIDLVRTDTSLYNFRLAEMGSALSQAAYEDYYIKRSLENLGYLQIERFGYNQITTEGIACALGIRNIIDEGKIIHHVAIVIRGTYELEWVGDFLVKDSSTPWKDVHSNFYSCALSVSSWISEYLKLNNINQTNLKLFVTGHSRGAAVTDLLVHNFLQSVPVTAYTFAAPNSTENPTNDSNIFNIINVNDLIVYMPSGQNWGKHGQNIVFGDMLTDERDKRNDLLIGSVIYFGDLGNYVVSRKTISGFLGWALAQMKSTDNGVAENHGAEKYLENVPRLGVSKYSWDQVLRTRSLWLAQVPYQILNTALIKEPAGKAVSSFLFQETMNCVSNILLSIGCPVNVEIFDQNEKLIAYFENHEQNNIDESIIAGFTLDEEDIIILPDNQEYKVVITAVDDGTMDVQMLKYDNDVSVVSSNIKNNVPIKNKEKYIFAYKPDTELENIIITRPQTESIILTDEAGTNITEQNVYFSEDSFVLTATAQPETSHQYFQWESNDESVAKVDENGIISFLKNGTVTITVTASDGSDISVWVELTKYLPGDFTGDNQVNILDLILLKKYILNKSTIIHANPDITDEGQVNILDLVLLKKHLLDKNIAII